MYGMRVSVHSAGRTDAGVHACRQYVHYTIPSSSNAYSSVPVQKLQHIIIRLLPRDIRIEYTRAMPNRFHARYDAISRSYCYAMYAAPHMPAPYAKTMTHVSRALNWRVFLQDAHAVVGKHDFSNFCVGVPIMHKNGKSTMRTVWAVSLVQEGQRMQFYIQAQGFLWRMVRCIVGTLIHRASMPHAAYAEAPPMTQLLSSHMSQRNNAVLGAIAPPTRAVFIRCAV